MKDTASWNAPRWPKGNLYTAVSKKNSKNFELLPNFSEEEINNSAATGAVTFNKKYKFGGGDVTESLDRRTVFVANHIFERN